MRADPGDPFAVLGLTARTDLTDDDVRSAWRRVAAATHPDRPDGGDPVRFAQAAAAYTSLRTRSGRGEALADLSEQPPRPSRLSSRPPALAGPLGRVRRGRPGRLAVRLVVAVLLSTGATLAEGGRPATLAVITGVATWLVLTAPRELAPPGQVCGTRSGHAR